MTLPPLPNSPDEVAVAGENSGEKKSALSAPETARVSIVSDKTQFDLSVPTQIPISLILNDITHLITARTSNGSEENTESGLKDNSRWTLKKIGGEAFSPDKSLAQLGAQDGDLLLVTPQDLSDTTPIYDDVIEAITELSQTNPFFKTSKIIKWLGYSISFLTCVALMFITLSNTSSTTFSTLAGAVTLATSVLIFGTTFLQRKTIEVEMGAALTFFATLLSFSGAVAILGKYAFSEKMLIGITITGFFALLALRFVEKFIPLFIALVTSAIISIITVVPYIIVDYSGKIFSITMSLVCLLALANVANITVLTSKLPLPPVPTVGESLKQTDSEYNMAINGISAVTSSQIPELEILTKKAKYANNLLTGLILGICLTTVMSILFLFATKNESHTADNDWKFILFSILLGLTLLLRNRIFADPIQSAILVSTGAIIIILTLIKYASFSPMALSLAILGALLLGLGAFATLILSKNHNFTPVQKRFSETIEYLVIASLFPLAIWIMGVYGFIREI